MQRDDFAYLSIIRWPDGYSVDDRVAAIVEATGLDHVAARQRVVKGTPAVVHRFDASLSDAVMAPLKSRRIGAFCITQRVLDALPDPKPAKSLSAAVGAAEPMYLCEIWRDESVGFLARDLFMIVRARLRLTQRGETQIETRMEPTYVPGIGLMPTAVTEKYRYDKTKFTDMLDLYLLNGTRIRVNGDKFNFDVLGTDRGMTDNENMDKLALRLGEESPLCRIDNDFQSFICPSILIRGWRTGRNGEREIRNDSPAFEFYSAWSYLFRKALAGREK